MLCMNALGWLVSMLCYEVPECDVYGPHMMVMTKKYYFGGRERKLMKLGAQQRQCQQSKGEKGGLVRVIEC